MNRLLKSVALGLVASATIAAPAAFAGYGHKHQHHHKVFVHKHVFVKTYTPVCVKFGWVVDHYGHKKYVCLLAH
jgi:hypothetical protein